MKLSVVRHAQSLGNAADMVDYNKLGTVDTNHLSEHGHEQARDLARELEGHQFDVAIVSPLLRTRETIQPFLDKHPIPVVVEPLTTERDAGIFAGKKKHAFQDHIDEHHIIDKVAYQPEDGESILEVYERAKTFLAKLKREYRGKSVLLCGHVNFLRCLDIAIEGGDIMQFYTHEEIKNREVKTYEL